MKDWKVEKPHYLYNLKFITVTVVKSKNDNACRFEFSDFFSDELIEFLIWSSQCTGRLSLISNLDT